MQYLFKSIILKLKRCNLTLASVLLLLGLFFYVGTCQGTIYTYSLKNIEIESAQNLRVHYQTPLSNYEFLEFISDVELVEISDIDQELFSGFSLSNFCGNIQEDIISKSIRNIIQDSNFSFLSRAEVPLFILQHSWKYSIA